MLTSFFDLLTNPIITFGIPIIIVMMLQSKNQIKKNLFTIIKCAILWIIGYLGMWALKWTITDVFFGRTIISNSLEQILFRTNKIKYDGSTINFYGGLENNIIVHSFINILYLGIGNLPSLILPFIILTLRKVPFGKIVINKKTVLNSIPFFIISLIPIIWYIIVNNHSYYHWFFTYRNLLIFEIGFDLFLLELIQINDKKQIGNTN